MSLFDDLEQSVGLNMPNLPADVRKVKEWLREAEDRAVKTYRQDKQATAKRLHEVESHLEQVLADAIKDFQRRVMGDPAPSGKVSPGDKTARKLKHPHGEPPKKTTGPVPQARPSGTPLVLPKRRGFDPLSDDDFAAAAKTLGCEARMIHALAEQEGRKSGFDSLNRPVILWEPLHFAKHLRLNRHTKQYPELTHLLPRPHQYGLDAQQYPRLYKAYLINPRAALLTPSWGRFQILGDNYQAAGYGSIESFVAGMCDSEQMQLSAFVHFIQSKHLEQALQDKDWSAIGDGYNGLGSSKRVIKTPDGDSTYAQELEKKYNRLKD